MARPNAAARLSEDIGDVLSSIRRLIAEDEAIGAARANAAARVAKLGEGGVTDPVSLSREDALARRFGGNAALARDLVSAHRRAEPVLRSPRRGMQDDTFTNVIPAVSDQDDEATASSGDDAPSWTFSSRFRVVEPTVLRLEAADRVPSSSGTDDPAGVSDTPAPWRAWKPSRDEISVKVTPDPAAPEPAAVVATETAEIQPAPVPFFDIDALAPRIATDLQDAPKLRASLFEDEDDFAEQFDAIARQQHVVETPEPSVEAAGSANTAQPPSLENQVDPDRDRSDAASIITTPPAPVMDPYPSLALRLASAIRGRPLAARAPAEMRPVPDPAAVTPEAPALVETGTPLPTMPVQGPVFSAPAPVRTLPEPSFPTVEDIVDDPAMRALVREIIGEELHGELGTRFARNLRAVIRREVAAAIEDQMDRF
ncbi:hypothetical protein [Paracoccus albicereus]|nr:hypothetical protein [Paracoccus albicereus]